MKKLLQISLIFILTFLYVFSINYVFVNAETNNYTDVFDDLRKDENFDISKYPIYTLDYINKINNDNDKTNDQPHMQIIQIAESSSDELYIYVYQPCDSYLELYATSILMSDEYSPDGQNIYPDIYELELVSTYNQFDKYVVKDFVVSDETYRYYNLVTLYRLYNSEIDSHISGTEEFDNEIGMEIGQQWCATYIDDKLIYEMGTFETIELDVLFTGNIDFDGGLSFNFVIDEGQSWFVIFKAKDYQIQHIFDADLTYNIREMSRMTGSEPTYYPYGSKYDESKKIRPSDDNYLTGGFKSFKTTLTDLEGDNGTGSYEGEGLLSKKYEWERIMDASSFHTFLEKNTNYYSEDILNALEYNPINNTYGPNIWVFSFLETEKSSIIGVMTPNVYYQYDISKVTIIRLHFIDIYDNTFNLGVVSDRVNPDNKSDGGAGGLDLSIFDEMFEKIMAILGFILLVVLISFIPPVANIFSLIFKIIFNGFYIIVSFPFKIVGKLFNIGKKNKP